jgi:GGDEF domain-containing protein
VARLGGDEFVILLENLNANIEEAARRPKLVGEKVLAALARPYLLGPMSIIAARRVLAPPCSAGTKPRSTTS